MIKPMLCKLALEPFQSDGWVWEQKFDGVRAIITIDSGVVSIQARSGTDKTAHFQEIRPQIIGHHAILDGEIVCESFQAIQSRTNRIKDVALLSAQYPATFHAFDILAHNHIDLQGKTLNFRKSLLALHLIEDSSTRIAEYSHDGQALYDYAVEHNLEGVVGKRLDQPYMRGKRAWLKVKTWQEDTFIACGYKVGQGRLEGTLGALVLEHNDRIVGEVGTGFTDGDRARVLMLMQQLPWRRVRIKYLEYTNDGQLRFPVFLSMEE